MKEYLNFEDRNVIVVRSIIDVLHIEHLNI